MGRSCRLSKVADGEFPDLSQSLEPAFPDRERNSMSMTGNTRLAEPAILWCFEPIDRWRCVRGEAPPRMPRISF